MECDRDACKLKYDTLCEHESIAQLRISFPTEWRDDFDQTAVVHVRDVGGSAYLMKPGML